MNDDVERQILDELQQQTQLLRKTTMMMVAMTVIACGCGRDSSAPAGGQAAQTNVEASVEVVRQAPAPVELKRVTSSSPTQHQFRMSVALPGEEPAGKKGQ